LLADQDEHVFVRGMRMLGRARARLVAQQDRARAVVLVAIDTVDVDAGK